MSSGNAEYQPENDAPTDSSYKMRPGQGEEGMNVVDDTAPVQSGVKPGQEDSDAQLEADDKEAINTDNIMDSKTRGAGPKGGYKEPGDEEGLPADDGTSSVNRNV